MVIAAQYFVVKQILQRNDYAWQMPIRSTMQVVVCENICY